MAHKHVPADWIAMQADRQTLVSAASAAVARLDVIVANIGTATTAQMKTAIGDIAGYLKYTIRQVVRLS